MKEHTREYYQTEYMLNLKNAGEQIKQVGLNLINLSEFYARTEINVNFNKQIEDCEISVRLQNGLKNHSIKTLGELTLLERSEIYRIPNIGKRSLSELIQVMAEHGLKLKTKGE